MADICCCQCGYVAQYEDVSDGDFDVENSMCYECSVAEERGGFYEQQLESNCTWEGFCFAEAGARHIGGCTHTTDERRFATPMTFRAFCDTDKMDDGTPHDWADVMGDGIAVNSRTLISSFHGPKIYDEVVRDNLLRENSQRMLREIDLLGPRRIQRHLSSGWVPGNVGMQSVERCGLVKGALNTSPVMCGGGGGGGGTM